MDTGSKEEEYGKFVFLFNSRELWLLVINNHHSDLSYSLNKIILDLSPVFFGLVEAGNSQPGSGATWEVVRIQQSGFCQFPASRKFPYGE